MRNTLLSLLATIVIAAPGTSLAQVQLGVRTGVDVAAGDVMHIPQAGTALQLSDGQLAQVPFQLDAGVEVTPALTLGGYFGVAGGIINDAAAEDQDGNAACGRQLKNGTVLCTGFNWRAGFQGSYAFTGIWQRFVPWLGLGLGYESVSVTTEDDVQKDTVTFTGYELALRAGGDFRLGRRFALGPYAGVSVGQFRKMKLTSSSLGSFSGNIPDKAYHEWIGAGVRGTFTL
jgi:hypothetical protein